ncbi:MAG TPA: biotin/lipoyl-containing protein, partial [Candidatus Dormibacteraeota bacterium]|nr:biotin/lipoyl-containing protein [Candidatus Dormibacteraeota bacterium]
MGRATLKMPQLGESVTEGTVDRWLKQEGDLVHRDEPIVDVVTDKVNAEIPSPFEGRLVRIAVQAGQTVPIGAPLAELEVEGAADAAASAPTELKPETGPTPPQSHMAAPAPSAEQARISPAVRKLVQDNQLDLQQIA